MSAPQASKDTHDLPWPGLDDVKKMPEEGTASQSLGLHACEMGLTQHPPSWPRERLQSSGIVRRDPSTSLRSQPAQKPFVC